MIIKRTLFFIFLLAIIVLSINTIDIRWRNQPISTLFLNTAKIGFAGVYHSYSPFYQQLARYKYLVDNPDVYEREKRLAREAKEGAQEAQAEAREALKKLQERKKVEDTPLEPTAPLSPPISPSISEPQTPIPSKLEQIQKRTEMRSFSWPQLKWFGRSPSSSIAPKYTLPAQEQREKIRKTRPLFYNWRPQPLWKY